MSRIATVCVYLGLCAACGSNSPARPPALAEVHPAPSSFSSRGDGVSMPQDAGDEATVSRTPDASSASAVAAPPRPAASFDVAAAKRAAEASNKVGFDLYPKLSGADKNAIFSPASLTLALAMVASGARGETLIEMQRVLHTDAVPDVAEAFAALLASMNALDGREGLALRAENRIWGQHGASFNRDFLSRLSADFGAAMEDVDFLSDPKGVCNAIDEWASGVTHGRVAHLFDSCPGPLMLADAVYFKGRWQTPFETRQTTDREFRTLRGEAVRVPTMSQETYCAYAHVDGVKVLDLPYRGGLSMIVAVPDDPRGLGSVERHLGAQHQLWRAALASAPWDVTVFLPKWTANPEYRLAEPLRRLGMRRVFLDGANLTGIDENVPLKVKEVVQGTFITVEEEGTEAAAVTGVSVVLQSLSMRRVEFHADRPFVYLIEDRSSGAILFMGRVVDPR